MRPFPLLALAVLLLAGCATPGEDPVADGTPTANLPLSFGLEVPLPQLAGAGEPNIAVLPDGTLFVTAPVGGSPKPNVQEGAAYLWRSQDGGATWETLRSPELPTEPEGTPRPGGAFCSCDADVVASPDGWVYYSDWWIAGVAPGNYLVEASADGGDTWTVNSLPIPQNLVASMDRQWLVAGDDGFVALFYSFFASTPLQSVPVPAFGLDRPGRAIEAVYSNDHGQTWTDPMPVVPSSDRRLQIGHQRMTADGDVWMPYGSVKPGDDFWRDDSEVRAVVVDRNGAIQSDVVVAEAPEGFDNLWAVQGATDPGTGRSYAVWAARVDDRHSGLYFSWSDDLETWSEPYAVRDSSVDFLPWADAAGGKVTFGWYGGNAGTEGDPVEAGTDEEWFAWAAEWDTALGLPTPQTVQPAKVSDEPVKLGPLCPRGAACGGDRELLDYVSMVYAPDGRLHYAFARSSGADAFVQVASQAAT